MSGMRAGFRPRAGLIAALGLAALGLAAGPAFAETSAAQWIPADCPRLLEFSSRAHDLDSGELIYTEGHRQCRDPAGNRPLRGEIRYFDPGGKEIGYKRLDYAPGATAPDFRLDDHRAGYVEGARRVPGGIELFRSGDAPGDLRTKVLEVPDVPVIDSGFDEFVRINLERIRAGDTVRLTFVVAGRLDSFRFRARAVGEESRKGRTAVRILVEHDSFFVRMLIDPITLWYDAASGRLLEYRGISNVSAPDGTNYDARIVYSPEVRVVGNR